MVGPWYRQTKSLVISISNVQLCLSVESYAFLDSAKAAAKLSQDVATDGPILFNDPQMNKPRGVVPAESKKMESYKS